MLMMVLDLVNVITADLVSEIDTGLSLLQVVSSPPMKGIPAVQAWGKLGPPTQQFRPTLPVILHASKVAKFGLDF